MRHQGFVGFAFGVVAAASAAVLVAAAKPVPTTSPAPAGTVAPVSRYQVVHLGAYANADTCWVIDTTNGHLWHHSTDGSWEDQGMPPAGSK